MIDHFGPLSPLHRYLTTSSTPITRYNAHLALIVPFAPLGGVAWLLLFPNTRNARVAITFLGLAVILHAWSTYRFVEPEYNAFNNGLGVTYLHLSFKYLEFALLRGPIRDPYSARGRSSFLSAIDLCVNSRWVGLGDISSVSKDNRGLVMSDELRRVHNFLSGNPPLPLVPVSVQAPVDQSRWLPPLGPRPTSRIGSTLRHARRAFIHYAVLDTLLCLLRHFGRTTIGITDTAPGAWDTFLDQRFTLLPRLFPFVAPRIVVLLVAELSVGAAVWQGLSTGYHACATLAVGCGLYEVDAWDRDLFHRPWASDSLIDIWSRGWHQLFRHHFLLYSSLFLTAVGLNPRGPLLLPLIFALSAGLHICGELTMSPAPSPLAVGGFFLLSGLGCALELAWKRVTGRRVGGWAGRVWLYAWVLWTGRGATRAWMEAGMGGSALTPLEGWSFGRMAVPWIEQWVVGVEVA